MSFTTLPRLIPAHAGKTPQPVIQVELGEAHPRSRGENVKASKTTGEIVGSSPLTRGKRWTSARTGRLPGLIPAHAGKTGSTHRKSPPARAHPRSRGENERRPFARSLPAGSSPLTRGKPSLRLFFGVLPGLIPAHAGKTPSTPGTCSPTAAHPRSRGENNRRTAKRIAAMGSSPLTRGKHSFLTRTPRTYGLIPAHAGKTRLCAYVSSVGWAHPRSRGENGDGGVNPRP